MTRGRTTESTTAYTGTAAADSREDTTETTVKNTTTPIMSSSAAMGRSVSVTGPAVLNSRTMEIAGAGAVARAIPPKIKPRYRGTSVKKKMISNTSVTSKNVPIDWVKVVMTVCFPVFFIFFHTSSVPIRSPTAHSRICIALSYHTASSMGASTSFSASGPSAMPAISQPRMAGNFISVTSFPTPKAITMAARTRRTDKNISIIAPFRSRRKRGFPATFPKVLRAFPQHCRALPLFAAWKDETSPRKKRDTPKRPRP